MPKFRSGHAPGHYRDMLLAAIDLYCQWPAGTTQPTVDFEIHYEPRPITLRKACGLLWNCTDQLPSQYLNMLADAGSSYARAATAPPLKRCTPS